MKFHLLLVKDISRLEEKKWLVKKEKNTQSMPLKLFSLGLISGGISQRQREV